MGKIFEVSLSMNIFAPYSVVSDIPSTLHIAERGFFKVIRIIFFRLFPVLFLIGAILLTAIPNPAFPIYFKMLMLVLSLISLLVIYRLKYPAEVIFSQHRVDIVYQNFLSQEQKSFSFSEIENLQLKIRRGKNGGLFYSLKLKQGGQKRMFRIPRVYKSKERQRLINERLQLATGLKVETK